MIESIGIGLSGLQKATQNVETAANNIANIGSVTSSLEGGDTIDLSEEAVKLLLAETQFKANVATIRTADELSGELLDIFDDD